MDVHLSAVCVCDLTVRKAPDTGMDMCQGLNINHVE